MLCAFLAVPFFTVVSSLYVSHSWFHSNVLCFFLLSGRNNESIWKRDLEHLSFFSGEAQHFTILKFQCVETEYLMSEMEIYDCFANENCTASGTSHSLWLYHNCELWNPYEFILLTSSLMGAFVQTISKCTKTHSEHIFSSGEIELCFMQNAVFMHWSNQCFMTTWSDCKNAMEKSSF